MVTFFVCHAKEDKKDVARPIARALREHGFQVWYDEFFGLHIGGSLKREIEEGLRQCTYAVVILSHGFFDSEWAQRELDVLVNREMGERRTIILPVWHEVTHSDVLRRAPLLVDRIAGTTDSGIESTVAYLLLAVFRDIATTFGVELAETVYHLDLAIRLNGAETISSAGVPENRTPEISQLQSRIKQVTAKLERFINASQR